MVERVHSYEHVQRVFQIAIMLAEKEKADLELVQIAALLHDLGEVIGEPHNETGAKKAKEILRELDYPKERCEKVERIIRYHNFANRDKLESLEEKIVWDADKIEGLGATGISRAFHWRGEAGLPLYDLSWFWEQATPRYDLLNTSSAKKLARHRYDYMMKFVSILKEELSLTDLKNALKEI